MPKAIELLMKRGYWAAAEEGAEGSAGAPASEGSEDAGDGDQGDDKGDAGSEGAEGSGGDADDDSEGDKGKGMSDADAKLLKEVMQKKQTIKEMKAEMDKLQKSLGQWEGLDPEEVKQLLKAKKDAETKRLEDKGEWDKLKKQMVDQHTSELDSLKSKIAELEGQLGSKDGVIEKLTVGHSFDNSRFIVDELTLTPTKARIVYGAHFDIEDGQVVGYDRPRGTEGRTQLIDGKGEPLSFDAALKKIIDADPDREQLIRSKAKPGAKSKNVADKPAENRPKLRGYERIAAGLGANA